ncbi:MAG: rhodanese-like domain-containing protein [Anaerolineae bacterium]|nr:rhodanese-like domain-containing protein [Anaerolineae bacterium]
MSLWRSRPPASRLCWWTCAVLASNLLATWLGRCPAGGRAISELDKTAPTVVYCAHGYSSVAAAGYLMQQGFGEVYSLKGGITTWQAEGNPVEEPAGEMRSGK